MDKTEKEREGKGKEMNGKEEICMLNPPKDRRKQKSLMC